jgi:hypothetical protein
MHFTSFQYFCYFSEIEIDCRELFAPGRLDPQWLTKGPRGTTFQAMLDQVNLASGSARTRRPDGEDAGRLTGDGRRGTRGMRYRKRNARLCAALDERRPRPNGHR